MFCLYWLGVSLNAIIGDNGVITNAQKAKIEAEEAELWENVQMVLVEGMGQDLDREKYVEEVNKKFESQGLKAKIGLRADGYAVTYGKYSRKVALLNDDLQILGEIVAVEGSSKLWASEAKEDGTLRLTEYKGEREGEIQIPNIIDGQFVTEIGIGLFMSSDITSVNIPEGIEIIGKEAFYNCENLNCTIIFPSSLKAIRDSAFYGCIGIVGNLNSIVEQGITTGKNVFAKCGKMTGDINVLIKTLGDEVTKIEENQFSGFSGVTGKLTIPARITSIEANAFSKCSGLTAIEFEDNSELKSIGNYAFSYCTGLSERLKLPNTVEDIGEHAFYKCSSLSGVDLSNGLKVIEYSAFLDCSNLGGELIFPVGLNEVKSDSFAWTGSLDVRLADGRKNDFNFGDTSFRNSSVLSVTVCKDDIHIQLGYHCFWNTGKLETFNGSDKINSLAESVFSNSGIKSIDLSGITELPNGTFSESSLNYLPTIAKMAEYDGSGLAVTKIGSNCFKDCKSLSGDVINYLENSSLISVGDAAFDGCGELTGEFKGSIKNNSGKGNEIQLGSSVFDGTKVIRISEIEVNENNELILGESVTEIRANQFANSTKFIKKGSNNEEIKVLKIPDKITSIGSGAFSGCISLTGIEIPDSVQKIESSAFKGCTNLSSVNLPKNNSFKKIPDYCFENCKSLSIIDLSFGEDGNNVKKFFVSEIGQCAFRNSGLTEIDLNSVATLGNAAFSGCTTLEDIGELSNSLITIPGSCFMKTGLKSVVIPDSVTKIDYWAFAQLDNLSSIEVGNGVTLIPNNFVMGCKNLKKAVFHGTITRIDERAFASCTNLSEIEITWDALNKIEDGAFLNCSSLKYEIELNKDCYFDEETTFAGSGLKYKRKL